MSDESKSSNTTKLNKPKIFIVAQPLENGEYLGQALAEDGTGLASHLCSKKLWVRHDMGINSRWKHEFYDAHYPNGYELVDLTDIEPNGFGLEHEYLAALEINHANMREDEE
jgi:hypothetical protein